jgi:hypothetical protein
MHPISYYLFLGAVLAPPITLAAGFLYLVSPTHLSRAERKHTDTVEAH